MRVFLAGRPRYKENFDRFDYYRLESFYYIDKNNPANIHDYKDFILDSGVFTFLNAKTQKKMDWYEYAAKYADFVKLHEIKNYVEIDVEKFIGLDEMERLRDFMEKRVGWQCMPVWHLNRGWAKWEEICRSHKYICFGAFITDGLTPSQYSVIPKFLSEAKKHDTKVHGLGFTAFTHLKRLKFYSVDSSTWTVGNRFGSVPVIRNGIITNIRRKPGFMISDRRRLEKHALNVWIEYAKYAEKNL